MTILEERGFFWWHDEPFPNGYSAPPTATTGLLKIEDEGRVTLELDGFLTTEEHPLDAVLRNREAEIKDRYIEGILKGSSQRVLLSGLIQNGGQVSSAGMSYEGYAARDCLVGHQRIPVGVEPPMAQSLEVDLGGFEEWLRLGAIQCENSESGFSAKYKKPDDASYAIDDGMISIKFHIEKKFSGFSRTASLSLKEKASLVYDLSLPETLDALRMRFSFVEDFFILLTNSTYRLSWPWVRFSPDAAYRWYFSRIRNREIDAAPRYHECWTNFPSLRDRLGDLWSNWKRKREEFGPGFYLYFGTRRGLPLFAEHRFMNLIWGIEALDRKKNPSAASSAYLAKIARIVEQVTVEKDKTWLEGRLRYAYEPNLEDRIFRSFKRLPLDLDEKRLRKFAKACADRRNEISHHGGHGKIQGESYSDFIVDISRKSDALSTLYHALVLHEIEVDENILKLWVYKGVHSYPIKVNFVQNGLLDKSVLRPEVEAATRNRNGAPGAKIGTVAPTPEAKPSAE